MSTAEVISIRDYQPNAQDLREMDLVLLAQAASEVAEHVRANPEMYRGYKNDLLEASFQVCRALDSINQIGN